MKSINQKAQFCVRLNGRNDISTVRKCHNFHVCFISNAVFIWKFLHLGLIIFEGQGHLFIFLHLIGLLTELVNAGKLNYNPTMKSNWL